MRYSLLFAALFTTTLAAHAQSIPEVDAKVCPHNYKTSWGFADDRGYWDATKTFCFELNGQKHVYNKTDMKEIKLREDGQDVAGEYFDALSAKSRRVVGRYKKFYVRYFETGEAVGDVTPFVVHAFYSWGTGTQTTFFFGNLTSGGDVRWTGFSTSATGEAALQAPYYIIADLVHGRLGSVIHPGRGRAAEATRLTSPVGDVIRHYRENSSPVTPNLSKP